jgi:hypothetical protein
MRFELEGTQHEFKGIKDSPYQVIRSHIIENIIEKGSTKVVVRLYFM